MSKDFNIKSLQDFERPFTFPYKHKIPSELVELFREYGIEFEEKYLD